jgi:hypothetical protein
MHDCASVWECEVLCYAENVVGNVGADSDSGYVGLGMAGDESDKRPGPGVNIVGCLKAPVTLISTCS